MCILYYFRKFFLKLALLHKNLYRNIYIYIQKYIIQYNFIIFYPVFLPPFPNLCTADTLVNQRIFLAPEKCQVTKYSKSLESWTDGTKKIKRIHLFLATMQIRCQQTLAKELVSCFYKKFYWNIAMFTWLHIGYG